SERVVRPDRVRHRCRQHRRQPCHRPRCRRRSRRVDDVRLLDERRRDPARDRRCRRRRRRVVDQPDRRDFREPVGRVLRFSRHRRESGGQCGSHRCRVRREPLSRGAAPGARMNYEQIRFESTGGIVRITLDRPDRLNSFTSQMHEELRDALRCVANDGSARVVMLTGAGRGFCAGQDLADRAVAPGDTPVDLGASIDNNYRPLVLALRNLALPVVCAVNGVAAGAGANIALACDIVIATRSASFIQAFCRIGLIPDAGGTFFLPRLVGTARAMGLALLGDKLTAEQAEEWGLIWKCVDDDAFASTVDALLAHLAQAPTGGLAAIKRTLYASPGNTLEQQLTLERDAQRVLGQSADYREGVTAFLAKRPPSFT